MRIEAIRTLRKAEDRGGFFESLAEQWRWVLIRRRVKGQVTTEGKLFDAECCLGLGLDLELCCVFFCSTRFEVPRYQLHGVGKLSESSGPDRHQADSDGVTVTG